MRWLLVSSVVVVVCARAAAQPALTAQGSAPYPAQPAPYVVDEEWYGTTIAVSDAAGLAVAIGFGAAYDASLDANQENGNEGYGVLALLGGVWWMLGTPAMHLNEGNLAGSAQSVGVRFAAPLLGALAGHVLDGPDSPDDPYAGAGLVVGVAAASVIDIVWIARKRRVRPMWAQPMLNASRDGVQMGLIGAF